MIDAGWVAADGIVALRLDVVDGKTRGYSMFLRCGGVDVNSADGTDPEAREDLSAPVTRRRRSWPRSPRGQDRFDPHHSRRIHRSPLSDRASSTTGIERRHLRRREYTPFQTRPHPCTRGRTGVVCSGRPTPLRWHCSRAIDRASRCRRECPVGHQHTVSTPFTKKVIVGKRGLRARRSRCGRLRRRPQ